MCLRMVGLEAWCRDSDDSDNSDETNETESEDKPPSLRSTKVEDKYRWALLCTPN